MRLRDAYNNNLLYDPFAIKPNVKFAPPGLGPDNRQYVLGPKDPLYGYWQDIGAEVPGNVRVRWAGSASGDYALRVYVGTQIVLDRQGGEGGISLQMREGGVLSLDWRLRS